MKRFYILLEIILIFFLPVLAYRLGWLPIQTRLFALEIFVALLLLIILLSRQSWRDLGFRTDTFWPAVKTLWPGAILIFTLIGILYYFKIGAGYYFGHWWKNSFFLYYLFLGAPSQELAFRGYLLNRSKQLTSNIALSIFINALLFCWLHTLHHDYFVTIGTFLFGAYLTWAFLKHPNIYATSLAHGLVGAAGIILGFF